MNESKNFILALDIGGTYIKYAIMDDEFHFYEHGKIRNMLGSNLTNFYLELRNLYGKMKMKYELKGVAISSLGIINCSHTKVFWCSKKFAKYRNFNFSLTFNHLPIYLENDVNSACVGEAKFGILRYIKDGMIVTLGTGIGGGIIVNSQLYRGNNNFAGEVGSMMMQNNLTWEEIASVKALINNCPYPNLNSRKILELAKTDPLITDYVNKWYHNIAIGVLNLCYILNPRTFVIGGGVSEDPNFNLQQIKNEIYAILQDNYFLINNFTLQKAKLGNKAALYGVAYLFFKKYLNTNNDDGKERK